VSKSSLYSLPQQLVEAFHHKNKVYTGEWPHVPPEEVRNLRKLLIIEEVNELVEASDQGNIVLVADALADLLYVVYGTALAWGIDIGPIFKEVHRSNMSKSHEFSEAKAKITKIVKGPDYSPPNLEPLLEAQIPKEGSVFAD
jgi:predicted HAD superfamily Cof-like phosphohydrolase